MENKYLFVYGTLKRGFGNNRLINQCKLIGDFISVDRFDVSGYGFPCAYLNEHGKLLKGEIYELSETDFIMTDGLESNGYLYQREIRKFTKNGKLLEAWIYIIIEPFTVRYETDLDIIDWNYSFNKV